MRKLLIFVFFLFFSYPFLNACGTHGLYTQSDVNNLICTGITNDVTIEERTSTMDPIVNLDSLVTILSIGTDLIIRNNPNLRDISGLSSLAYIGGDLIIENNPQLEECCALDRLVNLGIVKGRIIIQNNGLGNCNNDGNDINACAPIPTLSVWGIITLGLMLVVVSVVFLNKRSLFFTSK